MAYHLNKGLYDVHSRKLLFTSATASLKKERKGVITVAVLALIASSCGGRPKYKRSGLSSL
jgi:hypothetical protein